MSKPRFIEDKEQLKKLAPVANRTDQKASFVCSGKPCLALGNAEVKTAFEEELQKKNLRIGKASKGRNPNGEIILTDCSSVGLCSGRRGGFDLSRRRLVRTGCAEDVPEIIEEHLINGNVVKRLAVFNKIPA